MGVVAAVRSQRLHDGRRALQARRLDQVAGKAHECRVG